MLYFQKKQKITIERLNTLPGLFNLKVKFKYYRNKVTKFTQCSNCQELGHGTDKCFKEAVCVRCAGAHPSNSNECQLLKDAKESAEDPATKPKAPEDKLKCALCKNTGHSAAWSQCKVKLEYQEKLKSTPNMHKENLRHRQPRPPLFTNVEYPDLSRSSNIPHKTDQSYKPTYPPKQAPANAWARSSKSEIPSKSENLFSLDECFEMIDFFTNELLKCTTVREQISTITRLSRYAAQKVAQSKQP